MKKPVGTERTGGKAPKSKADRGEARKKRAGYEKAN